MSVSVLHWRRQLWALGHVPRLPASYFGGSLALQILTNHAHSFLSSKALGRVNFFIVQISNMRGDKKLQQDVRIVKIYLLI